MRQLARWAPWFFVAIWSQGFLVAKYAFFNSDVIFFLAIRMSLAALIILAIAKIKGISLLLTREDLLISILMGIALQVIYLGGVWQGEAEGAPAGIASVITSLQPLLVSLIAVRLLGEPLKAQQVIGLILGFVGVLLVLAPSFARTNELTVLSCGLLVAALLGSTSATLTQKKIGHSVPLVAGTFYQFVVAAVIFFVMSLATQRTHLAWNLQSGLAMAYAVLVTSVIAILILLWMLTHGSAAKVSSLLYLVPPMTAVQAFILFDEKLNAQGIVGIIATTLGVALVQKR